MNIRKYIFQNLLALDQLANTLFFGGWADETMSARCYREKRKILMFIINLIFFFQPQHCKKAYESEILRLQLPKEYRKKYIK
jgi:NADH:ubiquinone oxidoreductase subunit H